MSVLFQIAVSNRKGIENGGKKETIIYQCQCGYITTSGYEELLRSHLEMHRREARRLTPKMKEFFND